MKKIFSRVMAGLAAAVLLAGCSAQNTVQEAQNTGDAGTASGDKVYKVGICQLVQHEALDAATQGFQDVLKEKLGDKVEFSLQNASNDSATCSTIVNQFVSSNSDLIFANATPALQAAAAATSDIPIVGTSITDYATALDIDEWKGVTGRNITGTADLAPLEEQANMFKELIPDNKKVGLLYCSSEANSKYQIDEVKSYLEKMGFECKEYAFADSNDVAAVTQAACSEMDALYIPTDNTAASNTEIIAGIASDIPIISGEEGICRGCGLATLSISYYDLGKISGEMAYDILVNNEDPSAMEIKYAADLKKKYVPSRAEKFGITVPDDYQILDEE